ncbi:MAG: hypothetical protein ACE5JL_00400 [Dehalococcoidia bacterium]
MKGIKRPLQRLFVLLAIALFAPVVVAGEWKGLKMGVSTAEDAKRLLGKPTSVYPDYLLFSKVRIKSVFNPDTIVVNLNTRGVIESLFIFPLWGLTDADIEETFGSGKRMTYGEFLEKSGIKSYGAGTRAVEKLHYMPLKLPCDAYAEKRLLVLYADRGFTSGDLLVKLIVFY